MPVPVVWPNKALWKARLIGKQRTPILKRYISSRAVKPCGRSTYCKTTWYVYVTVKPQPRTEHVPVSYLNNEDAIRRTSNGLSSSWYITDVTCVVPPVSLCAPTVVLRFGYNIYLMCIIDYSQANVWFLLLQVVTNHDHEGCYLKMAPSNGKTSRSGQVSDLHQKDNQKDQKRSNVTTSTRRKNNQRDTDDIQKGMGSGRGNKNN